MFLERADAHQDMIEQTEEQLIETEFGFAAEGGMGAPEALESSAVEAGSEELTEGMMSARRSFGGPAAAPAFVGMLVSHPDVEADLTLNRNQKVNHCSKCQLIS